MLKKVALFLLAIVTCAGTSRAESFKDLMECQKNIQGNHSTYEPEGGYLLCGDACYLVYEDLSAYQLQPPEHPTFSVKEIFIDVSSERTVYKHRLSFWKEPRSGRNFYVDLISRNGHLFWRPVTQGNTLRFDEIMPKKVDSSLVKTVAQDQIERNLDLMKSNIVKKLFPPGWDDATYKDSVLRRISGCAWNAKVPKLKLLAEGLGK